MEIDTPTRRVLATRLKAISVNDWALVRECEFQLARWGVSIEEAERTAEKPEQVVKAVTEKRTPKSAVKKLSETASK